MDNQEQPNSNQGQDFNNGGYQQPNNGPIYYQPAPPPQEDPDKCVMTTGQWLVTVLISCIPCVGIIMMFVWAFGEGNENRKNFCRAMLIVQAIALVLVIAMYGILGVAFFRTLMETQNLELFL